jgi:regulator of sirC expression with transglutaminase-like and TPR domain
VAWLWKDAYQAAAADATSVIDAPVRADQLTAWAFRARGVARANLGQLQSATSDYQAYLSLWPEAPDRKTIEGWIQDLSTVAAASGPAQIPGR